MFVGTSRDSRSDAAPQAARITVTGLPGGSGVTFDYEGLNLLTNSSRPFGHREHATLARTANGLVLYTSHIHAPLLAELREIASGEFETIAGTSPFPLQIHIGVPVEGQLTYTWVFGEAEDQPQTRISAEVTLVER